MHALPDFAADLDDLVSNSRCWC